jgi:hypothetical protein
MNKEDFFLKIITKKKPKAKKIMQENIVAIDNVL